MWCAASPLPSDTEHSLHVMLDLFVAQVVHRLAVFDSHGEITNVITQTGER